jgi:hypothetical protein
MLALPGNEDVLSINPVGGETNDGYPRCRTTARAIV